MGGVHLFREPWQAVIALELGKLRPRGPLQSSQAKPLGIWLRSSEATARSLAARGALPLGICHTPRQGGHQASSSVCGLATPAWEGVLGPGLGTAGPAQDPCSSPFPGGLCPALQEPCQPQQLPGAFTGQAWTPQPQPGLCCAGIVAEKPHRQPGASPPCARDRLGP